jgi:hypothetical protein
VIVIAAVTVVVAPIIVAVVMMPIIMPIVGVEILLVGARSPANIFLGGWPHQHLPTSSPL